MVSEEGHLMSGTPTEPCEVAGVPVAAGVRQTFHDDGTPLEVRLGGELEVVGVRCPEGATVAWSRPGQGPSSIEVPAELVGWGQRFEGPHVFFLDEKDGLRLALPCRPGNASARGVGLAAPATVNGLRCRESTVVELHLDGRVKSLVLDGDQRVGKLLCRGNTQVTWLEDGALRQVSLVRDTTIRGVPCAGAVHLSSQVNGVDLYSEYVVLHPNGEVAWAKAAEDATVAGVPIRGGETVCLHEDRRFHLGTTTQDWRHPDGWVAAAGTLLALFPDGSPNQVVLAEPFELAGTLFPAGTQVRFSAPGVLGSSAENLVPLQCESLG